MSYSPDVTKLGLQFHRGFVPNLLQTVAQNYPNLRELIIFCNCIGSSTDAWYHTDLDCLPEELEVLVIDACQSEVDLRDLSRFKNLRTTVLDRRLDRPQQTDNHTLNSNPTPSSCIVSPSATCRPSVRAEVPRWHP